MNPDKLMEKIRGALGNPTSGQIADALPLIEGAIRETTGGDTPSDDTVAPKPKAAEQRITKPTETR